MAAGFPLREEQHHVVWDDVTRPSAKRSKAKASQGPPTRLDRRDILTVTGMIGLDEGS
jgi:hypothetical protein